MTWYWWLLLIIALAAVGVFVVKKLLTGITAWGGDRTDGLETAAKFSAEADALRGSSDPNGPTWDGTNRIAPPKPHLGE